MKRFQDVILVLMKCLLLIISVVILIIGISSIFVSAHLDNTFYHQSEDTFYTYSVGIVPALVACALLIFIYLFSANFFKKIESPIYMLLLLIFCGVLFFGWINALKLYPLADQEMIYKMASDFLKEGNLGIYLAQGQYLFYYPFQFGLVLFVTIFFKIFGANFMVIEYVNCVCTLINIVLLYKISNRIFDGKNQKILILLELLFAPYWMFFNVHFYGNIIGLSFALLAVYLSILFTKNGKLKHIIFSGFFIALAIIIKTNYLIFLIGIIIYLVGNEIIAYKKDSFEESFKTNQVSNYKSKLKFYYSFRPVIAIVLFLFVFKIVNWGYAFTARILLHEDLPEGIPMIAYIYMGMDEPTDKAPGWYNDVIKEMYLNGGFDTKITTEQTKEKIFLRQRFFLLNPRSFVSYYSQKLASTWLNPTFQTIWCSIPGNRYTLDEDYAHYLGYHEKLLSMVGGDLYKLEEIYFDALQVVAFIFAGFSIMKASKETDTCITCENSTRLNPYVLLPIIFIGGFAFHIIWETKAIYVLQYYFLLLPYAADGISKVFEKINKKITHKKT